MGTEVASAYVSLIPSARGFTSGVVKETDKAATTAGKRFGNRFAGSVRGVLGGALAGIGVTKILSDSLGEAREAQKVGALTDQVIKSTGRSAHVSAKQVGNLATEISNKVGVDDEAIQSGENMLLTFRNIRNEAGRGNKVFNQATHAVTDVAAAMAAASGGELNFRSAAIQVGKALNDPVKGITALSRVGVSFDDQQKAQIKTLVAQGKTMDSQKIILRELRKEFGGAAASQATDADKARVALGNLEEQVGTALLPVVDDLATKFTKDVVPAVSEFVTQMQDGSGAGGKFAHDLHDIYTDGKNVVEFLNDLPGPVKKFAVEGGIALAVLGKMRGLFGPSATAINGFVSGMANAETRMGTTTNAARRLGSGIQTLAGAGGLIALQDGAKKTDSVVGALETTLGGAAAGFAVGGPVGAAVGGLGGLTYSLFRATKAAHGEAKVAIGSWKDYGATLDGVRASTTKATRELVYNRLEQSGLLDATRKLGLTDREAVAAVMGKEGAQKKLNLALNDEQRFHAQRLGDNVIQALLNETGAIDKSRRAQLEKNLAIAKTKDEVARAQAALDRFDRTHANATIGLTGAQKVRQDLKTIRSALNDVFNRSPQGQTAGPGGLDVLLNPKRRRAAGGPVLAGQPYIVGEKRPELFVPNQSGRIIPRVPALAGAAQGGSGPQFEFSGPIYAQDVNDFLRQVQVRARRSSLDGVRR